MSENREEFNAELEEYKAMTESSKPELGMKWFNFLIYFNLFFGALEDLLSAAAMIFDIRHEVLGMEYYFEGNMRWLGILFGILWIIIAAAVIYIRFDLAKFKKGAPKRYIIIEVIGSALFLLYSVAGMLFTASSGITAYIIGSAIGSVIGSAIGTFVFAYCNVIYFKKRDHLFIN